jgi:hypothetical protein
VSSALSGLQKVSGIWCGACSSLFCAFLHGYSLVMADQMWTERRDALLFCGAPASCKSALWLDPALSRSVPVDLEYESFVFLDFEYRAFAPRQDSVQVH